MYQTKLLKMSSPAKSMKVLLPYNGGIKKPNPFKTLHSIVNTRVLKNKKKLLHQITQSIYF